MKRFLSAATLLLFLVSNATAGIMGSAVINVSNLTVTDSSGTVLTASFDANDFINAPVAGVDIAAISSSTDSTNRSSLTGYSNGGGFGSTTIDRDNGFGEVSFGFAGPIAADAVSGNLLGDYTRAASSYQDSFVSIVSPLQLEDTTPFPAPAVGADGTTSADFSVDTTNLVGSAGATVSNRARFDFISATTFTDARLTFGLESLLNLFDDGTLNPGYASTASTSLTITLTEQGGNTNIAEFEYFESISGGNATGGFSDPNLELIFDLNAGEVYTLDVTQTARIAFVPVPEPGTALAFAGLFVPALVMRRRRRS